jgi:hypothetical protein
MSDGNRTLFTEGPVAWAVSLPAPVYGVLALVGAIAGFVYGVQQPEHHPQYLYAILGGLGGLLLIPAIALAIQFTIQCVIIGLLGLAAYYAFFK